MVAEKRTIGLSAFISVTHLNSVSVGSEGTDDMIHLRMPELKARVLRAGKRQTAGKQIEHVEHRGSVFALRRREHPPVTKRIVELAEPVAPEHICGFL